MERPAAARSASVNMRPSRPRSTLAPEGVLKFQMSMSAQRDICLWHALRVESHLLHRFCTDKLEATGEQSCWMRPLSHAV